MKKLMIIGGVLLLVGCRSYKETSASEEKTVYADTLSIEENIAVGREQLIKTGTQLILEKNLGKVDFVREGGEIRVDADGAIIMSGVAGCEARESVEQKTGNSAISISDSIHIAKSLGSSQMESSESEAHHLKKENEGGKKPFGCFVACALPAIIVAAFLIRRKWKK